jgi:formylglycine-generating enzyme required for sulfatase activity
MGQPDGESDEQPVHRVRVTRAFYLGIHEVTQAEYRAVTGNSPSSFKGDDWPVEQVSAGDADEFCRLLTERERAADRLPKGSIYRLPTEAEWEYAARAGTTTKWCCGDDERQLGAYAWYDQNAGLRTHPAGQKRPNAWGLFDLHGNVCEWCSDWYDEDYYKSSPLTDPRGAAVGSRHVVRGGGWDYYAVRCRSACRLYGKPACRDYRIGFRVVLAIIEADSQTMAALVEQLKTALAKKDATRAGGLLAKIVELSPEEPRLTSWQKELAELRGARSSNDVQGGLLTNSIGMKLRLIPAGEFQMGQSDGKSDEQPVHRVRITRAFYLGIHEVTQAEYRAVTGNSPSFFKGDDLPVEQVSAGDADEFCRRLTERERRAGSLPQGASYRLPTEAEWEYAARAGTTTKWCFGDDEQQLGAYAWYNQNSGRRTHPAGQKRPNAWGLFDLHGNVCEWCSDWYDGNYYKSSPPNDPRGSAAGSFRVLRGGHLDRAPVYCRSACRRGDVAPANWWAIIGFRVVCER